MIKLWKYTKLSKMQHENINIPLYKIKKQSDKFQFMISENTFRVVFLFFFDKTLYQRVIFNKLIILFFMISEKVSSLYFFYKTLYKRVIITNMSWFIYFLTSVEFLVYIDRTLYQRVISNIVCIISHITIFIQSLLDMRIVVNLIFLD